jgi:hypothetical protein
MNFFSVIHNLSISSLVIHFSRAAFFSLSTCSVNIFDEYLFDLKKKSAMSPITGTDQTRISAVWYHRILKQSFRDNQIFIPSIRR